MTSFAVGRMRLRVVFSLRLDPVAKRFKTAGAVGLSRSEEEGKLDSSRELVGVNVSVTVRVG